MQNRQAGRGDWLLLVLLALAASIAWLLFFTPEEQKPGDGTAQVAVAENGASPNAVHTTNSGARATEQSKTHLDVFGQITCPKWSPRPDEVLLKFSPQPGTKGEARTLHIPSTQIHFELTAIEIGNWELSASADGFQSFKSLHTISDKQQRISLLVPMVPANVIRGRVSDSNGVVAANCTVSALRIVEDKSRAVQPLTAISNQNGEFTIEGVRPGAYQVFPGPPRAGLNTPTEIHLAGAEAWVELNLPPTSSAKLTVLDFESGEGVPKLVVTARRWQADQTLREGPPDARDAHLESARTNEDGIVIFHHLPPGEYSFTAQGNSYRQRVVRRTVILNQQTEVSLRVRALKR